MVYVQFHAPVTLHNNVYIRLMNTKFLASLYILKQLYGFFLTLSDCFISLPSQESFTQATSTNSTFEASFTVIRLAVTGILLVTACFV